MDELITWLRACLDIDQAHAEKDLALLGEATGRGEWTWRPGSNLPYSEVHADGGVLARIHTPRHQTDTMVIARLVKSGRARATERLAEIEAKRRRLDWIVSELADDDTDETAQWLAKLEAQPYAGRDGWRAAWLLDEGRQGQL